MLDPMPVFTALEKSHLGQAISRSIWIFPAIEMVHMFGIVALVGATSILDLRLMGLMLREESVTKMAHSTLHWAWVGASTMFITGGLMFVSEATKCYTSYAFRVKMVMMVLAGLNALIFHTFSFRSVNRWEIGALRSQPRSPARSRSCSGSGS